MNNRLHEESHKAIISLKGLLFFAAATVIFPNILTMHQLKKCSKHRMRVRKI